jgi:ABC-2 type transport system permease protein
MVVLTQLWIGLLFLVSGKLCGLSSPVPPELAGWLLFGAAGGIVICAIQLCISLIIRSFAVPVGIALIGGVLASRICPRATACGSYHSMPGYARQ